MVNQHYRWDFIGLSTDVKPTSQTSEKVVNGSTFYCSDNSKLYVYCDGTWYERQPLGGGGTSYTAGEGIEIADNTISVDTDTIQEKLTAGTGIDITDNTISASGGDTVKVLTSADYNYHRSGDADDGVAIWKLEPGLYDSAGVKIYVATDVGSTVRHSLYVCAKASDAVGIFISQPFGMSGNWAYRMYRPNTGERVINDSFMTYSQIVDSTGISTSNVMTQNATTSMVFADPSDKEKIQIGKSSVSSGSKSIAIGSEANVGSTRMQAIAIGSEANAGGLYSVAIGSHATTSQTGEFNIGCGNSTIGYNSSNYRLLTGLYDPQSAHDAATKGYVDAISSYSESEVNTGVTWIDGKTIYKKSYSVTLASGTSQGVNTGITNMYEVVKIEAIWHASGTLTSGMPTTFAQANDAGNSNTISVITYGGTNIEVTHNGRTGTKGVITLYYTKSS